MYMRCRAWYERKMYWIAKVDFWGGEDMHTCDLCSYHPLDEHEELFDIYLDDVEIMNSTFFYDKKKQEIFEKDIVRFSIDDGFDYVVDCVGIIKYRSGQFVIDSAGFIYDLAIDDIEVIGNLYENGELLEV